MNPQDLLKNGRRAEGTVTLLRDTGGTINDQPVVNIEITLNDATTCLAKTGALPRISMPRTGDTVYVLYDPAKTATFLFSRQPLPASEKALAEALLGPQDIQSETRSDMNVYFKATFLQAAKPFVAVLVFFLVAILIPWPEPFKTLLMLVGVGIVVVYGMKSGKQMKAMIEDQVLSGFKPVLAPNEGERATAKILSMQDTYVSRNDNPVVKFVFEVHPKGKPSFQANAELLVSRLAVSDLLPGKKVNVRFDPANPKRIMLD